MAQQNSITRSSLTTPLLFRYGAAKSIADVGNGSAKMVGIANTPGQSGATNFVDVPNAIQKGFFPRQPIKTTMFTPRALSNATTIGLNSTRYWG